MSRKVISGTLASAVADDATFTASYPTGTDEGRFTLSNDHKLILAGTSYSMPVDFTVTLGTASITVTNKTGASWPAGSDFYLELQVAGKEVVTEAGVEIPGVGECPVVTIPLGAPDTADVDGIFEATSQAAGSITLGGALASGGVVTFDVPRNIVVDSGGADTSAITFTGTDVYGNTLTETITLNGTTAVAGNKAFKTITAATNAATISNGAFAGPGSKLGLPVALPAAGCVIAELEDGAAATAGTIVAADVTAGGATATTGDVRGTYTPNSTPDGDKYFTLIAVLPEITLGTTQA